MFYCKRCGTKFNPAAAGTQMACPRCRAVDGIYSPLTFGIFDVAEIRRVTRRRDPKKTTVRKIPPSKARDGGSGAAAA